MNNRGRRASNKSQRYFSANEENTNEKYSDQKNYSKIKGLKRKNDENEFNNSSPSKKSKMEREDDENRQHNHIDAEYAKTLITSIKADNTEEREMKLKALKKWFEDKFAQLMMGREGSYVVKDYMALLSMEEVMGEMDKAWDNMAEVVSGTYSSFVVKAFLEQLQQLKLCKEAKELLPQVYAWMQRFSEFCTEHLKEFCTDSVAIFILDGYLRTLGGLQKDSNKKNKESQEIKWHPVPKKFIKLFKKISSTILEQVTLEECLEESSKAVTALLTILEVLHHYYPQDCTETLVSLFQVFHNLETLKSRNGSLLAEKLWSLADESQQSTLHQQYLTSHLHSLATGNFSKFLVQRAMENCASEELFRAMCNELYPHFPELMMWDSHSAVLVSISKGCLKYPPAQKKFSKVLKEALQLGNKPLDLVRLALKLGRPGAECVAGSLLLQSLLHFDKPTQVVDSLLHIKGQPLADLACSSKGSHLFEAFFSSPSIEEKLKKELQRNLKPFLVKLAGDRSGSRVFEAVWNRSDPKLQEAILEEMLDNEMSLQSVPNWKFIRLQTNFNLYKFNKPKWHRTYGTAATAKK